MGRFLIVLLLLFTGVALWAQSGIDHARLINERFTKVLDQSDLLRKNYAWTEERMVIRNGDTVEITVKEAEFNQQGELTSKVISKKEAPLPTTFLISSIARNSKEKLVAFMERLKVFLEKYALHNDVKRESFFDNASVGEPDKRGLLVISGKNVFAPNDKLTWWIDTVAYAIHHATISTTFEETEVAFTAWYDYNRQGMNYMILTIIRIPSKKLEVRLKFYDFMEKIN
jgi:hypothetical protein